MINSLIDVQNALSLISLEDSFQSGRQERTDAVVYCQYKLMLSANTNSGADLGVGKWYTGS